MFEEQLWEKDGKLQTYTNRWEDAIVEPPVPPSPELNNVIDATSETSANVLTDGEENYLEISVETDPETEASTVVVIPYGIFEDEGYTIDDYNAWQKLFENLDVEMIEYIIENYTEFPVEIFEVLKDFYENPTEENYDAAEDALGNWIYDEDPEVPDSEDPDD